MKKAALILALIAATAFSASSRKTPEVTFHHTSGSGTLVVFVGDSPATHAQLDAILAALEKPNVTAALDAAVTK